ncbi:MAG TPA: pyridoxal phosphate-dependent aminotransferase [Longimicrobium sp.]|nr:pyridoxal phosphate-dependent aminotransferase [Longimicrobium sp.]
MTASQIAAPASMTDHLVSTARGARQSYIRAVTRWIDEVGGVNLGQGICPLPPHPDVIAAAHEAMLANHNHYTPFDGIRALKEALVHRYAVYNGLSLTPENVMVSSGATGAFESVCKAFLEPGDEVVLLDPVYNYHLRQVEERRATARFVSLEPPEWSLDMDRLEAAITPRTKLLVFANPHNPTGKVFTREELESIGDICRRHGVIAVVDEVYEYILPGVTSEHVSLATLPGMFDHTLTISAASKTLFVTGWRVGWISGPVEVMPAMGVKNDETYVCAPAPFQHAVARTYLREDGFFERIAANFQGKADKLIPALQKAGFDAVVPDGAYYVLADYRGLGWKTDVEAMQELIDKKHIGAIPASEFFVGGGDTGRLRFCFALPDDALDRACDLLTR